MNLKTLSAVTLGVAMVALGAGVAKADSYKPADQFHWSSPIVGDKFTYNLKEMALPMAELTPEAQGFVNECKATDNDLRVRGFMGYNNQMQWSKAEFLCGKLSVGGDAPVPVDLAREVRIFGAGYKSTLPDCQPYTNSNKRIWTHCGAIVPNNGTSKVLVGDGRNAGMNLKTDDIGSGIDTVEPVLFPEVETMRVRIFKERVASGYYKN